ncbi:MAG: dihydropteroate synthase [Anaerolineales bacterium]|nr:dihydropteroate synthase [Anaerolineales bacterium]
MPPLTIGSHTLTWGERTYVMGILNLTPDSFSGDGLLLPSSASGTTAPGAKRSGEEAGGLAALVQARNFLAAGADILDIGGESTRPGSQPVDAEEEKQRVLPAIRAIASEFPDALISIDTCKAAVAEEALRAGAHILNDVWGLRADPELAVVAARAKAPVVLMHNRSKPANVEVRERLGKAYTGAEYENLLEDVKRELMDSVAIARSAGIPDECILLDPGIGFGKTIQQNLELINRLDEIRLLGFPVLLGPSRKSFIGYTLDLPPDQRVEGTAAAVAVGITRGADIVRVHDVEVMVRVARMTDALVRPWHGAGKHA